MDRRAERNVRRSTRAKRSPSLDLTAAERRKKRCVKRPRPVATEPRSIPPKSERFVDPASSAGAAHVPATVFLSDDLETIMWTLDDEAVFSTGAETSDCSPEQIALVDKSAVLLQTVDEYFPSKKAAMDSASGRARMYRHIGFVNIQLSSFPRQSVESEVKRSTTMPELVNVESLIPLLKSSSSQQIISSLHHLSAWETSPWKTPFILTLTSAGTFETQNSPTTLTVQIFAGRLLFELIGNSDIAVLFESLQAGANVHPLPERPVFRKQFEKSLPEPGEDRFTFAALLRRAESEGYADLGPDASRKVQEGLSVNLLGFQRQNVQWMIDRENDKYSINDYFWQQHFFSSSSGRPSHQSSMYFFPKAGELRLNRPPVTRGGMVTDEMGLGKTVSALGLVVAQTDESRVAKEIHFTPDDLQTTKFTYNENGFVLPKLRTVTNIDTARADQRDMLHYGDIVLDDHSTSEQSGPLRVVRWPPKTTLIVVPPSLLSQWEIEVKQKAPGLRVVKWSSTVWESDARLDPKIATGEDAVDVILVTYDRLRRDSQLGKVQWARVILDEAQNIRKGVTAIARDVLNLRTNNRFMMTGTPLTKNLNDIAGEMAFLKVWPFTLEADGFWERKIFAPWQQRQSSALLDDLLRHCMIRHTKSQKGLGLDLPRRSHRTIKVFLRNSHRAVYCYILGSLLDELDRDGPKDLRVVRTLFNILRLSCISPDLVGLFALDFARRTVWRSRSSGSEAMIFSSGDRFRQVSGKVALEFIAEAGQRMNRDTTRTFAMADDRRALVSLEQKTTAELRLEIVSRRVRTEAEVTKLSRDRIIGLLAGGIYKLETDTLQELRQQALDNCLVTAHQMSTLPRERAYALLRRHMLDQERVDGASRNVHSAGFQALATLIDGGQGPTCPVCIGVCESPSLTKCAHFYCSACLRALFDASPHGTRCAVCRRGIDYDSDVVEVVIGNVSHAEESKRDDEEHEDSEEQDLKLEKSEIHQEDIPDATGDFELSSQTPWSEYEALGPPPDQYCGLSRLPQTPSLDPSFLGHLQAAQDAGSPKLQALLDIILSTPANAKFVVVAEATSTLQSIGRWLREYRIGSVGADMESFDENGDRIRREQVRSATDEFMTNPWRRVFLLNTAGSSGLTLTRASYVIFMEPLSRKADEIQAAARVHRIGQRQPVEVVRIVTMESVEHGILNHRNSTHETISAAAEATALSGVSEDKITESLLFNLVGRSMDEYSGRVLQ